MWRQCTCGFDFGPPEPETLAPSEPAVIPNWLDGISPEQAIRSIRVRMLLSWAVIVLGLVGSLYLGLRPLIWWVYLAVICVRRRIPESPAPEPSWPIIASFSALILVIVASIYVPHEILPFLFIPPLAVLFLYFGRADVKQFRSPLEFFSPEDRARLKEDR